MSTLVIEGLRASVAGREILTGVDLEELGSGRYTDEDNAVVGRAFLARWSGAMRFDDGEVVAVDRVPLGDLEQWVAGRPVCADSAAIVVPMLLARLSET